MTIFWWILDLMVLASAAVSIYWQSQITLRAKYNYWSLGYGVVFGILLTTSMVNDWSYIVFTAVRFTDLETITLIQQPMPGNRSRVIAVFRTKRNRRISLVFTQTMETLLTQLRKVMPNDVAVEVR
ncbi:hypothetical protein [Loigolactobacillus coryniformis]|uniref:Uncharacterized protein n=1 Tax=Loigolactobacillus coryniformis TaxID=1610 RepID=A0A5B8TB84_9LACO|nr:hypothetical protein [Loigolactobacillus coryniformis]QEA51963.1 hypothetical protein FGL77_00525 [Loigolactobacillus coryniformis]